MPEIFASILHDENDVMLCKNEEHKVPRVQSAMEMMHECHASCHDSRKFYKIATEKLLVRR